MKRKIRVSKLARVNTMKKVKWIPSIRLAGNWLSAAGIQPGCVVEIEVLNQKLIVTCRNTK
ncbi:SymE family type I addiction module toxin [Runella defluvii]|uniref:SymE family type I addiction module toxin n=1 Tax=Runella defluvii TaxID=370973 RepID=UPI0035B6A6D9